MSILAFVILVLPIRIEHSRIASRGITMVGIIDRSVFIIIIFKREPLFLFFFFFFFEGEDKSVERNYFWIVATGKITGTLTRFELLNFLKRLFFMNAYIRRTLRWIRKQSTRINSDWTLGSVETRSSVE